MVEVASGGRRLTTLEEFLGDFLDDESRHFVSCRHCSVSVRSVSGELLLGPELLPYSTTAREIRERLQASSGCLVRLVGEGELLDGEPLGPISRDGTVQVTAVLTLEPTADERRIWIDRLERGDFLQHLPLAARSDAAVVHVAVDISGESLRHAAEILRTDREFIMALARRSVDVLPWAEPEFRRDPDVVMAALEYSVAGLRHADPSLLAERLFMLQAVRVDGQALRYAHHTLRRDTQIVLAAVDQDETALQYAFVDGHPQLERVRDRQVQHQHEIAENCRVSHERSINFG